MIVGSVACKYLMFVPFDHPNSVPCGELHTQVAEGGDRFGFRNKRSTDDGVVGRRPFDYHEQHKDVVCCSATLKETISSISRLGYTISVVKP